MERDQGCEFTPFAGPELSFRYRLSLMFCDTDWTGAERWLLTRAAVRQGSGNSRIFPAGTADLQILSATMVGYSTPAAANQFTAFSRAARMSVQTVISHPQGKQLSSR